MLVGFGGSPSGGLVVAFLKWDLELLRVFLRHKVSGLVLLSLLLILSDVVTGDSIKGITAPVQKHLLDE